VTSLPIEATALNSARDAVSSLTGVKWESIAIEEVAEDLTG
jgi:hypothetical protein